MKTNKEKEKLEIVPAESYRLISIGVKSKPKKDCDNCKYFDSEAFESHSKLPCTSTNKKLKKGFAINDFWRFYYWAKDMKLFSCKGFKKKGQIVSTVECQ